MRILLSAFVFTAFAFPLSAWSADPSILFVGNSLTGVNNLPGLVLSYAPGHPHIKESLKFGKPLATHLHDPAVRQLLTNEKFDIVVLQELSDLPLREPAKFRASVDEFKKLAGSAKIYLFENWPYRGEDTIAALDKIYADVAAATGSTLLPFGDAMNELRKTTKTYVDDRHPLPIATYMFALIFAKDVFGAMPATHEGSSMRTAEMYLGDAVKPPMIDLDKMYTPSVVSLARTTAAKY